MSLYQNFLNDFKTAATAANRDIDEINLIAVSKKKSVDDIKKLIDLKHIDYGENQIQEVEKNWIDLKCCCIIFQF